MLFPIGTTISVFPHRCLNKLARLLGQGDREVVSVRCLNSFLSCGCDITSSLTHSYIVSSN
jgi:hypothetical protein